MVKLAIQVLHPPLLHHNHMFEDRSVLFPKLSWWYVMATLLVALFLNFIPWGQFPALPDFVAIVIVFWSVTAPHKMGLSLAFALGIVMDVNAETTLGLHSLAYVIMSAMANATHRRLSLFSVWTQALYMIPVFVVGALIGIGVQILQGHPLTNWLTLLSPIVNAVLWPIVGWFIRLPLSMGNRRYQNTL